LTETTRAPMVTPGLVALLEAYLGIVLIVVILSIEYSIPNIVAVFVAAIAIPIFLYVGILGIIGEVPEWSTRARRLNGLGTFIMIMGLPVGDVTGNLLVGAFVTMMGVVLLMVSVLLPGSIIEPSEGNE
jgi:hypothetical protein